MESFEVHEYSEESLSLAFSSDVISQDKVKSKKHFIYFIDYLDSNQGIGAKTIVLENRYVSKAYLSDYSNYYSVCFQDYGRICKRIHFFNSSFDEKGFRTHLLDEKSKLLEDSYLGYIVIKPLPDSIIGPTLLRTYGDLPTRKRHYFAVRQYEVNLFGRKIFLDSLAFQEQDTVVSACASTSIWSAFHKTSQLFQTKLPSPSEITKSAGNLFFNSGRTFPNQGLNITQICKAIEEVGLVSELRNSELYRSEMIRAKRFVYAYNKARIPVLLFIKLHEREHHLVTVVGFSEAEKKPIKTEEISLAADQIERFYIHDDQVGPFARLGFKNQTALETPWWDENNNLISAWIHALIVPLYPKIRISFDDIFKKINLVDKILFGQLTPELEWDIYLAESNDYKNEIVSDPSLSNRLKEKICLQNHPKYIWIARVRINGSLIFEFIFDSTDISRGHFCIGFNLFDNTMAGGLLVLFQKLKFAFVEEGVSLGSKMYQHIIKELKDAN